MGKEKKRAQPSSLARIFNETQASTAKHSAQVGEVHAVNDTDPTSKSWTSSVQSLATKGGSRDRKDTEGMHSSLNPVFASVLRPGGDSCNCPPASSSYSRSPP